jgi:hypothetical protein
MGFLRVGRCDASYARRARLSSAQSGDLTTTREAIDDAG